MIPHAPANDDFPTARAEPRPRSSSIFRWPRAPGDEPLTKSPIPVAIEQPSDAETRNR